MHGRNDNKSSKTARNIKGTRNASGRGTRDVVILVFDDAQLLDIAGPAQVFAAAAESVGGPEPFYRVRIASRDGGPVRTSAGVDIVSEPLSAFRPAEVDTLVISGGEGVHRAMRDATLAEWVCRVADVSRRTCSVCTGAFLLAEIGLLAGRRAVTHWRACDQLAADYPEVTVEADPIFVEDGNVWTSAGVTAGIDLALALVERDVGRRVALQVAQRLVVFLKRPGGQSQFSAALAMQSSDDGDFADLHDWMAANLAKDLRVERLAERTRMSVRNFARLYRARTGTTPAKAVAAMRVEAARAMLEETAAPVSEVARRCGYGDEEAMRRAFIRTLGIAPGRYRTRFAHAAD
jgi:transcriptional regulator GlxA family with amidase domain